MWQNKQTLTRNVAISSFCWHTFFLILVTIVLPYGKKTSPFVTTIAGTFAVLQLDFKNTRCLSTEPELLLMQTVSTQLRKAVNSSRVTECLRHAVLNSSCIRHEKGWNYFIYQKECLSENWSIYMCIYTYIYIYIHIHTYILSRKAVAVTSPTCYCLTKQGRYIG